MKPLEVPVTDGRRLAYLTYLVGQLSKLIHAGEVERYKNGFGDRQPLNPDAWNILRPLRSTQWSVFADGESSRRALQTLNSDSLQALAWYFSDFHKNCVRRETTNHSAWSVRNFTLAATQVEYLECELRCAIQSCEHRLLDVSAHPDVLANGSYKDRQPTGTVHYDVFLGRWSSPGQMRLIDGNHRAIQLTRRWRAVGGVQPLLSVVVPEI